MENLLDEKFQMTLETLESARRRIVELKVELEIMREVGNSSGLEMLEQQLHPNQTDQYLEVIPTHFIVLIGFEFLLLYIKYSLFCLQKKKCRRDPVRLFLANPDVS